MAGHVLARGVLTRDVRTPMTGTPPTAGPTSSGVCVAAKRRNQRLSAEYANQMPQRVLRERLIDLEVPGEDVARGSGVAKDRPAARSRAADFPLRERPLRFSSLKTPAD